MCDYNINCKFNFDEEPTLVIGNCTHKNEFRTEKIKVNKCKNLDEEPCKNLSFCHFNFD